MQQRHNLFTVHFTFISLSSAPLPELIITPSPIPATPRIPSSAPSDADVSEADDIRSVCGKGDLTGHMPRMSHMLQVLRVLGERRSYLEAWLGAQGLKDDLVRCFLALTIQSP